VVIGFLGDLHNWVFHGLAVVLQWQREHGRRFDLVVQIGDLGDLHLDPTDPNVMVDPIGAVDFHRFKSATGRRADSLRRVRSLLPGSIPFVRGNHDDPLWLASVPPDGAADPFDLFRLVRDGTVLDLGGLSVAFLGGVEEQRDHAAIDHAAYEWLASLGAGRIDLLVTHQGPYGSSIGFRVAVHGSPAISRLVERLEPRWHVAGHAHQLNGPRQFGRTTYRGLDGIAASLRWYPDRPGLQPGCLAVLDTEAQTLEPVLDPWLQRFDRRFDFDAFVEAL
jgi:hypothetical protein